MKDLAIRIWRCDVFWSLVFPVILGLLAIITVAVSMASARDLGQWENSDPRISEWYRTLMQPDNPGIPCCGEADAYWADEYHVNERGELIVTVTDDRPDEPLKRPHIPAGTKFVVPMTKLKWQNGNPTGHSILFVRSSYGPHDQPVYCFVQGGGA